MQLRADQITAHLAQCVAPGPWRPIYTVYGEEPLLVQETTDAIGQAARQSGYSERQVYTVAGAHFDWSTWLGAARSRSLFGDKQLIELRVPSGKLGKEGAQAVVRYCQHLNADVLSLVTLPKLDRAQQSSAWFKALEAAGVVVRIMPVEPGALPMWMAQRMARQGQRVEPGAQGQQSLAFFAHQVEGNLLAAHQEIEKLGLLYPPGEITMEQIQSAVSSLAQFEVFKLGETLLAGRVDQALRMLAGLQAQGESEVLVHWTLANDILAWHRGVQALQRGQPLAVALREARVWGTKERLLGRVLPQLNAQRVAKLVGHAHCCDGVIKGLAHPLWPAQAWPSLRQLVWMMGSCVVGRGA